MTNAFIYTRVSTNGQELDGSSLDTQEARCRDYCAEHGYRVIAVYSDTHTGAQYRERPGLSELRAQVRSGIADVVICYAVDRLSRNQAHLYILAEEINDAGMRLEFVTESFEDTAVGRFIRSAAAFAAEVEREKISERTSRGRRARVEAGKPLSGGNALYGYRYTSEERIALELDPVTSRIVRRIYDEYLAGRSLRSIAFGLTEDGIPSPSGLARWNISAVHRTLRHPNYTGSSYGWWQPKSGHPAKFDLERAVRMPDGTYPAIVTHEEWEAVGERMDRNRAFSSRNNRHPELTLLRSGIARCGICGNALVAAPRQLQHRRVADYRCAASRKYAGEHHIISIAAELLDPDVWGRVVRFVQSPETVRQALATTGPQDDLLPAIETIVRALADIDRRMDVLADRLAAVDNPTPVINALNRLESQRRQLQDEHDRLSLAHRRDQDTAGRASDLDEWCSAVASRLDDLTYDDKRSILIDLGVQAYIYPKTASQRVVVTAEVDLGGPIVLS